jgi:hypothetical protein
LAFAPAARADTTPTAETELHKATANAERQRAGGAKMSDGYVSPAAPALAAPSPAPAAANNSTTLDAVTITGANIKTLINTPVEQDATLSKRQWRKRIEQRLQQGDHDGARNSLRLFVGKYPQAKLPPDLRALLEE